MMQLWQRIRSIDFTACVQMYQVIGSTSFRSNIKHHWNTFRKGHREKMSSLVNIFNRFDAVFIDEEPFKNKLQTSNFVLQNKSWHFINLSHCEHFRQFCARFIHFFFPILATVAVSNFSDEQYHAKIADSDSIYYPLICRPINHIHSEKCLDCSKLK